MCGTTQCGHLWPPSPLWPLHNGDFIPHGDGCVGPAGACLQAHKAVVQLCSKFFGTEGVDSSVLCFSTLWDLKYNTCLETMSSIPFFHVMRWASWLLFGFKGILAIVRAVFLSALLSSHPPLLLTSSLFNLASLNLLHLAKLYWEEFRKVQGDSKLPITSILKYKHLPLKVDFNQNQNTTPPLGTKLYDSPPLSEFQNSMWMAL